ncbi:MAG TPA: cytochrome c oxidase subunit II [Gaiellaceae bacterium]
MAAEPAATRPRDGISHGWRVVAAWLIVSAIATPLVAVVLGPHLPPGNASTQASQQVVDNTVITSIVTPVICLILVFFAYSLIYFRAPRGATVLDGPPLRNDSRVQIVWIIATSVTVLFLAGFGTYELLQNGAGGGQGPSPVAVPSAEKIPVQVIGQQWEFTYRYPSFGGFETHELVLPADTYITFHVTSLDVVHSFWAYELGVKVDANPGVDNVAYVQTKGPTAFHLRCAELCGLFHGYMFGEGRVVTPQQFQTWAARQRVLYAPITKYLPPYSTTYLPDPQERGG